MFAFPGFEVVTRFCYDSQFPYDHQHVKNWEPSGSRNDPGHKECTGFTRSLANVWTILLRPSVMWHASYVTRR